MPPFVRWFPLVLTLCACAPQLVDPGTGPATGDDDVRLGGRADTFASLDAAWDEPIGRELDDLPYALRIHGAIHFPAE